MDLYEILLLPTTATIDMITKSYRKLAKVYHPDKPTGCTEKFQQINYAYNILVNEKTRSQYDTMNTPTKTKLARFLEEWFDQKTELKSFFKLNNIMLDELISNIEAYDFYDIVSLFNKMVIPTKKNDTIDCSDSDTPYIDETCCEYYNVNDIPLKYHLYNSNNIILNLKCTIDEIQSSSIRKIKINRKINGTQFIETTFYFKCTHQCIIFNRGGDMNGHLIIHISLPPPCTWNDTIIYYNVDINIYQYIYGIDIPLFNIINWIAYKDGNIIRVKNINEYILVIKLNTIYANTIDNKRKLEEVSYAVIV